jgi:hypothetical protein
MTYMIGSVVVVKCAQCVQSNKKQPVPPKKNGLEGLGEHVSFWHGVDLRAVGGES